MDSLTFEASLLLTFLLGLMAVLYASVGHAGSSGYQAAMALMGVSAALMKPTALSLNIVVATIATIQFARLGYVDLRRLLWLICGSVPTATLGGYWTLSPGSYSILVAVVLWLAAVRLWFVPLTPINSQESGPHPAPSPFLMFLVGAVLGLLSGLTGTGGGIFLTPLLVLLGWASPRQAAGLSAAFILANSPSALLGWWMKQQGEFNLPALLPLWMAVVALCGWLGAWFGSKYGSPLLLRRLLALVLVIAGAKMLFEGLK